MKIDSFRKWRSAITVLVCLLAVLAGNWGAQAQETPGSTGSIRGVVTDPQGQGVQGATVVVASASRTERTAVTGADGKFVVSRLAAGTYTVETSSTGFATQVRHNVTVSAGGAMDVSIPLTIASVSEEVTVEAEADTSIAAQNAPMKALLDEASPRTEISSAYIRNYTSPVTDFSDITQAAPGTVSYSTNGIGQGQAKTWYRGFADGNYSMTWDGVPFQDSNDPTHHSWAYVPAPAISYVDFDRSPGTASDIGPANFGGSIHMFSPKMSDSMRIKGSESYGSFNTNQYLGEFNSGLFAKKLHFWLEGHHMTSDGYQTNNFQVRTAATAKLDIRANEKTNLTFVGTSVIVDSNTPNNDPTRRQILHHGDNYLLDKNMYNPDGSVNGNYYGFYTYHVPTNFEIATFSRELGHGWKFDNKAYTYSYSNHQHYQNDQTTDLATDPTNPKPIEAAVTATSGINKLNQYNRIGNIAAFSQASKYGVLRAGGWYEFTTTNRYQIGSNPTTWVDSPNLKDLKFHEHFITQSFQPYVEYQLVAIPRWTITAGLKDAFYQMHLKQYADGKTVGNLGCTGKTIAACAGYDAVHTANYNTWLPSAQANYRVKSNWSVYGDYGRGSVIPPSSIFDTAGAQVAVTPEPTVADTIQGGTVLKLNRLMMDADVFHIHYQNAYSSYTDSTGFTYYYQSPASNTTGFEFEGTVALPHGLNFVGNSTVGQAKYEASSAKTLANGTTLAAAPSAWVAKTPKDTESLGVTFQNRSLDLGFFNKRIGERWDDGGGGFHQNINYDPFWMNNLFFNYSFRRNALFDQSKIKLSLNNLFDYHDAVGISNITKATATNVPYVQSANDQLQLLPGRSVMVTFQIGLSPKER